MMTRLFLALVALCVGCACDSDSEARPDAGSPADAGPPADAGSFADAGTPADAGAAIDAGSPADAGLIDPCEGRRPPPSMVRSDYYFRERRDVGARAPHPGRAELWQDLFIHAFPRGRTVLVAGLQPDEYAALRFEYGEGLPEDWTAMLAVNINQFLTESFADSGRKLWTFSTCPGDFNREAIEADPRLGPGCYRYERYFTTESVFYGGPAHREDPTRCALDPGVTYYLNVLYTDSPEGTPTEDLHWHCTGLVEDDSRTGCANAVVPGSFLRTEGIEELPWYRAAMCSYADEITNSAASMQHAREYLLTFCEGD